MSDIKIQPSATGSATVTLTAPVSNTARTITFPDSTSTLLASDGSGANLTAIPAANITGTLPALSAANLTAIPAGNLTGTVADARISALTASKLTGALPAISAASLTAIPAANITGTLPAISGANLTGLTASQMPAGSVLQVLMNIDSTEQTLATATYTDTGLTITITPRSTSSKFLCQWNMQAQLPDDSGIGVQLVRAISGGATTNVYTSASNADIFQWQSGVYTKLRGHWMYLDSPSTTSAITYKIQVSSNGGTSIGLNKSNNQSQLLVMEVAG